MALPRLDGGVALVTGASRGVGRGVALGLAEAGATVYITGRTLRPGSVVEPDLPGSLPEVVEEISRLGGRAVGLPCDHSDDAQVERVFAQILGDEGRLDILVNNAWGGYERMEHDGQFTWLNPFWEQPRWRWDAMFQAGVRAAFVAGALAARAMVPRRSGLIVNISFWAGQRYMNNLIYGVAKAACDRLAADMAHELRPHNVAAVALYPGLVRTERVLAAAEHFDMSNAESPQFSGRAVAALAADPRRMDKSGQALVAAALALEYGFTDIDGRQPTPLTLETCA